ncbi:MAG: transposase [Chitinispirillaceae bacterium]|nr:transposase [Chitinispirillaceae bacterium]
MAFLKDRIAWFERQIFGQKTERFVPDSSLQTQLPLDCGAPSEQQPTSKTITCNRKRPQANKTPHGRDELPAHLPRERVALPADFDTTGMVKVGGA